MTMDAKALRRRMILAPTPRERERECCWPRARMSVGLGEGLRLLLQREELKR